MEILDTQTDRDSLLQLAAEATGLLVASDFDALASRFGYALAYGRDRPTAIRDDLAVYLSELNSKTLMLAGDLTQASVSYFKANATGLFAAVECVVPTDKGAEILVSLVVTSKGTEKHLSLEGLCTVA